jgi:hypothetical protein
MNDIAEQRPDFFEGEYLGADDLQQLVVYMRDQSARHALGGHAWGIAAGLDLVEQPSPSGGGAVDVYLLPGYAIDGYGRSVVVVNPLRLTVDLLSGQPTGSVQVWLRYDQGGTKGVRPGFEVCAASDAYARVAESYALEVGVLALTQQQSGISVAGTAVPDAREAPRLFDDNGPIACDASVPYQDLPLADEKSRWLIPLGLVGWKPGSPGTLTPLSDSERLRSRRLRRYLGVVAENVLAADGLIRLRKRTTPFQPSPATTDDICGADDLANPAHDFDLQKCTSGELEFNELVWVEGRLRVTDDTRLLNARLEFRDAAGTSYKPDNQPGSVPLLFQRSDNGTNADLSLLVGAAKTGRNNFIIAAADTPKQNDPCAAVQFNTTRRVTVQDDGKVGIGPDAPDELLTVEGTDEAFLHLKATSGPHDVYAGATKDGGVIAVLNADDLRLRTGGPDPSGGPDPTKDAFARVTIKGGTNGGQVGVGTIDPDPNRLVTVEAPTGGSYLIARTQDRKHEVLLGADDGGATLAANSANDDLVLGANGGHPLMWIKADGKVGAGTGTPNRDLTVQGRTTNTYLNVIAADGREILMGADWTGTMVSAMTNDDLQLRAGGNQNCVTIKANKNVGVGTDAPLDKLDVRGNVRLGAFGELFAAGSPDNVRIIAGNVDGGGHRFAGTGFNATRIGQGQYRIDLWTWFTAAPVVIATSIASANDDLASTANIGTGSFEVHIYDTSLGHLEDNQFSFVAIGLR